MIVPMKKISLIVDRDKKEEALNKLRDLGIVHIEINEGFGEKLVQYKEQITALERLLFAVGKPKKIEQKSLELDEALNIANEIDLLGDEKTACLSEQASLNAEIERLKDWGDIDPDAIEALALKGIKIAFYETPKREYAALSSDIQMVKLDNGKNTVKFFILDNGEDIDPALSNYQLALPKISTEKMKERSAKLKDRVVEIDARIASFACYADRVKSIIKDLEKEIEFETYSTGMESSVLSSDESNSVAVASFYGYVEPENIDSIKQIARENS